VRAWVLGVSRRAVRPTLMPLTGGPTAPSRSSRQDRGWPVRTDSSSLKQNASSLRAPWESGVSSWPFRSLARALYMCRFSSMTRSHISSPRRSKPDAYVRARSSLRHWFTLTPSLGPLNLAQSLPRLVLISGAPRYSPWLTIRRRAAITRGQTCCRREPR
jgi:hypothetical protein